MAWAVLPGDPEPVGRPIAAGVPFTLQLYDA